MKTAFIKNSLNIHLTLCSFYQNEFFFIKNEPKEVIYHKLNSADLRVSKFISRTRLSFFREVTMKKLSSSFSFIHVSGLRTFNFQYKKFKRENNILFLFSKLKSFFFKRFATLDLFYFLPLLILQKVYSLESQFVRFSLFLLKLI